MKHDQTAEFESELKAAVLRFGIEEPAEAQTTRLGKHYSMLCRWNQRLNLTRITEPREAARLHYAECLFGASFIAGAHTVLDIGSGAGFPAVPIAIAKTDTDVTALEANQKKALFLKEAKDELGLTNLKVVCARLDEFDCAGYELLTSRALDQSETILPPVIERLSPRQKLMIFCGPDLLGKLEGAVRGGCKVETHPIPESDARILAIFSSK